MLAHAVSETVGSPHRLDYLRKAIRNNRVSFPAQVPVFACQHRADIQWRLAGLYFVRGWSTARLGQRYKFTSRRVHQLLRQWVSRAKVLGYLQEIPTVIAHQVLARSTLHEGALESPTLPVLPLPDFSVGVAGATAARPE
jgi:hypothetical protein